MEGWYLLAFANYSAKKYDASQECVNNLRQLFQKPELKDAEIEDATTELETKLKEFLSQEHMVEGEAKEEDDEGDYESLSESEEKKEAEKVEGKEQKEQKTEKMEDKAGGDETMEDNK